MVKPYWHSKERYETARECIEAQLKKYVVTDCYYWFHNGGGCTEVWDAAISNTATPEEMLDIAVVSTPLTPIIKKKLNAKISSARTKLCKI